MSEERPIPTFSGASVEALDGSLVREAILEQVEYADRRLWLAFFLIGLAPEGGKSVDAVVEALVRAARRGVDVRLLISPFETGPERLRSNAPTAEWLRRRGISARVFSPDRYDDGRLSQRTSMHAKTLIRDEKFMIVGSANLTPGGLDDNRERLLLIESGELVHQAAGRFDRAWQRSVAED